MTRRALRAKRVNALVASSLISLLMIIQNASRAAGPSVAVYQTTATLSQALTPLAALAFMRGAPKGLPVIGVDEGVRYQQFKGVGGAMTDSSAWLIYDQLSPVARARLLSDLFGPSGIELSFLRIPIGASDFTRYGRPYSYDPGPANPSLSRFSIAHDKAYVIPAIRGALRANPKLDILATPWSAPAWMKTDRLLSNPGQRGTLLRSAYRPLARYLVRFITAYASNGIPIDAITPQNEPDVAASYPSMNLPEPAEARLIAHYLVPALRRARLATRVYGWDGSWAPDTYATSLIDGPARNAIAGIAWHCYFGSPVAMSKLEQDGARLDQIVDECSPEIRKFSATEFEIASLRNWASVVAVWNLALDRHGGPVQPDNSGCGGCTGVVTINPSTHRLRPGAKYFQLGQVSKFVRPGAYRISSPHLVTYGVNRAGTMTVSQGLDDVAFLNPDGTKVLIAYDNSSAPVSFAVQTDGRFFSDTVPPGATATFLWR